jgi:hypothetical protein
MDRRKTCARFTPSFPFTSESHLPSFAQLRAGAFSISECHFFRIRTFLISLAARISAARSWVLRQFELCDSFFMIGHNNRPRACFGSSQGRSETEEYDLYTMALLRRSYVLDVFCFSSSILLVSSGSSSSWFVMDSISGRSVQSSSSRKSDEGPLSFMKTLSPIAAGSALLERDTSSSASFPTLFLFSF